jgi:phage terminase large subunit
MRLRPQPVTTAPADVFDFKNPDYVAVFKERLRRLAWMRTDDPANDNGTPGRTAAQKVAALRAFYRLNPDQFIDDWGVTFDPRNPERGLPAVIPFKLFPKQRQWVKDLLRKWRAQEPWITEKSRDVGMSWLSLATACTLCNFNQGLVIGFGSRKEEYVDKIGAPKSLFYKARMFMKYLPDEFKHGWDEKRDAPHMRINFPGTGSAMTGEAGDGIGRGDRASIYFVDESAFLERPQLVDASLSATTNCRVDISSANGMANSFAQRRHGGKIEVFTLHWRDDPRKDDAWYAKQVDELDAVTVAQEIDINYSASASGIIIPAAWVQAAVGAAKKLNLTITGDRRGALDVADEGIDKNAFGVRHGISVLSVTAWSGKGDDIFGTVQKTFALCQENDLDAFDYDADGLGAGVRGDARVINEQRAKAGVEPIKAEPFRGSGAIYKPDSPIPTAVKAKGGADRKERLNKDYFLNAKAQAWWDLRVRFQRTYRAVMAVAAGEPWDYDVDELINLEPTMEDLSGLTVELSQATYEETTIGKIKVNKAPDNTRSPNKADAVVILFAPRKTGSWLDGYKKR